MLYQRIRFVTANFYQLQGLRLLPLGVFLLCAAAGYAGWLDWLPGRPVSGPDDLGNAWGAFAFGGALLGAYAATAYYRRQYGAVSQHSRRSRNAILGLAISGYFALKVMDSWTDWPILLSALLISVSLFATVWIDGRVRLHYLVGAIAWLGVTLSPIFEPTPALLPMLYYSAGGLSLIVCGIGDHLLISETLVATGQAIDASHPTIV